MEIGFVGAGKMGLPMAVNVARKGEETVRLYDSRPVTLPDEAKHDGIHIAENLAALKSCEVVLLCLPDSRIVSTVIEGDEGSEGLADLLSPGATIIDCGSSLPAETLRLKKMLETRGIALFDAPVSGGLPKAWSGDLTVLAGGYERMPAQGAQIIRRFGSNIVPFENVGDGHVIKAANNYLLAANMVTCMEALAFAVTAGISAEKFAQAINSSSGRSYVSEIKVPLVGDNDAPLGFTTGLIKKDVANFVASFEAAGLALPLPGRVLESWDEAEAVIGSGSDSMRIYAYLCSLRSGL